MTNEMALSKQNSLGKQEDLFLPIEACILLGVRSPAIVRLANWPIVLELSSCSTRIRVLSKSLKGGCISSRVNVGKRTALSKVV